MWLAKGLFGSVGRVALLTAGLLALLAGGFAVAGASPMTVYVANAGNGTVTPIEVATNQPGSGIKVGSEPVGVAITSDGKTAYVTNYGSESVTPIEVATNTPGSEIKVGSFPKAVALTPDGKTAYVVNEQSGTVTPIEVATNKPGSEIKVGSHPVAIAVTPDGKTAYVANSGSSTVTPIEVATNTPGSEIKVGSEPNGVAVTPDGKTAYIANSGSDSVTPIEVATNTPGSEIKVGSFPWGVAVTPDGKTAYVVNFGSGTVTPIEVATNKPGSEIKVGSEPDGVAVTPDGKTAYVTNRGSATVTPIEVATNTPGSEIKVGSFPYGVAVTPAAAPRASITVPANGEIYPQGALVKTKFSCSEGEGGPGLESCEDQAGVAAPGEGELVTLTPGEHEYLVTAKSKDGKSATARITYTVLAPPQIVTAPNSRFSTLAASVNHRTGTITFRETVSQAGTFRWLLTFRNGKFGVFSASAKKCKKSQVKLTGRCRPALVIYAKGSRTVAAGSFSFTVKPSASALKALHDALEHRRGLSVTATLTFQSSLGGRPTSHTRTLTITLKNKRK
jgi:YVTN family beta-propeller protein